MNQFKTNLISMYGEKGKLWLNNLPELVKDIACQNGLSYLTPVTNLTYNYVLAGFKGKYPIILKLGLDLGSLNREADALNVFANHGAVKILSGGESFLLLERAIPGSSLKSYWPHKDDEAGEIVARIMSRLYQATLPKEHSFPTIVDWLTALDRGLEVPQIYLEKARALKQKLLSTCSKFKLLHGDLHHYNILESTNEWVIIDPKGVIGEPAYEAAYYIRSPVPDLLNHENAVGIIQRRTTFFAQALEVPAERILDWCFVQSVLSWIWNIEDGLNPTNFINLTEIFDKICIK